MNEKVVKLQKALNEYRNDVVSHISEQEPLSAVDIGEKDVNITNLTIAGEQYLVFSRIGEDGKIKNNITSIKFSNLEDVARIASWLKIIQNDMIQNATLSTVFPIADDNEKSENTPVEKAQEADTIPGTKE